MIGELRNMKWMIIASVGMAFGCAGSVAVAGEAEEIAAVREATAKYQDVSVALAEGFIPAPSGCITAAGEGLPAEKLTLGRFIAIGTGTLGMKIYRQASSLILPIDGSHLGRSCNTEKKSF